MNIRCSANVADTLSTRQGYVLLARTPSKEAQWRLAQCRGQIVETALKYVTLEAIPCVIRSMSSVRSVPTVKLQIACIHMLWFAYEGFRSSCLYGNKSARRAYHRPPVLQGCRA